MARTALLVALVLVGSLGGAEAQLNAEETSAGQSSTAPNGAAAKITAINFKGLSDPSEIEIQADRPISIQKTISKKDKQLILNIEGATLDAGIKRSIDTSSFESQVSLISPYQTGGANPSVRIVVQLRGNASIDLASQGNGALITIPRRALASKGSSAGSASDESESSELVTTGGESSSSSSKSFADRKGEEVDDMDQLLKAEKTKKFNGKPITLQVRDVDVQDVFGLIAETSGFNIILSDNVRGKLTLSLVDVPWDQALSIVLQTLHLGADRKGNVLRVDSLSALTQEKQLELAAKVAQEAVTPRITRIFPISYATLGTLKATIVDLATAEQSARSSAGGSTQAPLIVETDDRTNSLIIRGLPEYVDRAGKLIEILDTQTPQVLIEGKVVEATEDFSKSIGGSLGIVETESGHGYGASFNQGSPYGELFGAGGTQGLVNITTGAVNGASFGYTKLIGGNRINATLSLSENEGKVKVVSSPRAVVMNNKAVSIVQTFPLPITQTVTTATATTVTQTQVAGQLSLNVTPTVTSDGSVLMQLALQRDVAKTVSGGGAIIANRNITTNVLVESGTTLVMGGFYNNEVNESEGGIPLLRNIPIIGWLFGSKSRNEERSELMFFITPQVINAKKAGLVGST